MYELRTTINGSKKRFSVVLNKNITVASFDRLSQAATELVKRNEFNLS